jgi:preprotein translocase subunit SecA
LLLKYLISAPDLADPRKVPNIETVTVVLKEAGRAAFQARLKLWEDMGKRHGVTALSEKLLSHVMQGVLDEKWKDHLYDLDQLRNAIGFRAWGQKDPLVEYKQEAYEMFVGLMHDLRATFTERWLKLQIQLGPPPRPGQTVTSPLGGGPRKPPPPMVASKAAADGLVSPETAIGPLPPRAPPPGVGAGVPSLYAGVGRNDPCPCGSGKKFKKCHGAGM